MRSVKAGKFDAVITIFNAIGHLTKDDFKKTLQNIRANLKDNGIYIFDIFNLQAITAEIIDDFAIDTESVVNGANIHHVQYSEIDREKALLTSHDQYTIFKDGYEPEVHTNSFSLQIYTAKKLQAILRENGFKIVGLYDIDGADFIADQSLNILTVAKKEKA
jgi:SAM-dependent methyltransferase